MATLSNRPNTILALETSCDDTACAIVSAGRHIHSNVIASQDSLHQITGGVVPEVASRQHIEAIQPAIKQALNEANLGWDDIDGIAATLGPGLVGSLLIGANAGKTLSWLHNKPFIPAHHLVGHVCANFLESDLEPPFCCLLVSGGHTQLMHVHKDFSVTLLGQTLDDAVGEAYDKVGRIVGCGFPGGPKVDKLAKTGDSKRFTLPIARTANPYDFSYSGLKTAVARQWEKLLADGKTPTEQDVADMCASFQQAAITPLIKKTIAAAQANNLTTIAVCGGVSANGSLRRRLEAACKEAGLQYFRPQQGACTDNAAMIASAAYFYPLPADGDPLAMEVFSRKGWPQPQ